MIAYLSGNIIKKTDSFFILNTNGVGYLVFASLDFLSNIQEGKDLECFISNVVREQEFSLYGFENFEQRQFFELLTSVSGIGPKSALEFLNLPINSVKDAIATGDTTFLSKVKGVGKKTAERVAMELKTKVGSLFSVENVVVKKSKQGKEESNTQESEDVISALEGLGFERIDIVKKLQKAPAFEQAEDAVSWFLQNNG